MSLTQMLSMPELAERWGLTGPDATRRALRRLRAIEKRLGVTLVLRGPGSRYARCFTTVALLKKYAGEVIQEKTVDDRLHEQLGVDGKRLLRRLGKIPAQVEEIYAKLQSLQIENADLRLRVKELEKLTATGRR